MGSREEQREPPLSTCASEIYRCCWCASLHLCSLQGLSLESRDLALKQLTLLLTPETLPGLGINPLFPERSKHLLYCFTALSSACNWCKDVMFRCATESFGFLHFYYNVSKLTLMIRPCSSLPTAQYAFETKLNNLYFPPVHSDKFLLLFRNSGWKSSIFNHIMGFSITRTFSTFTSQWLYL